jgi:hypothetical protein
LTQGSGSASLRGRLLVATPGLIDPNFFRTVVLVIAHTSEGAAGVVLNRPSDTEVSPGPLEEWAEAAADPALIFVGGGGGPPRRGGGGGGRPWGGGGGGGGPPPPPLRCVPGSLPGRRGAAGLGASRRRARCGRPGG